MSLLRLTGVEKQFAGRKVFGPLAAAMDAGDKVGLIGQNGAGKTTLLRLIAGLEHVDAGELILARGTTAGLMHQGLLWEDACSLCDYVAEARSDIARLGARLGELEAAMANPAIHSDDARLAGVLDEYARVRGRFEHAGGYSNDAVIRSTLFGLGFAEADLRMPCAVLSGGQKARAQLARLLLTSPDLLLLDEPTNHLDMNALEWLEQYLRDYKGALLVISHDRTFLDAVVDHIWELESGGLFTYSGNYSVSRALREERRRRAEKEYLAQEQTIAGLEEYIRRYKAGNRSTMAKSREKALARLEPLGRPAAAGGVMRLRLPSGPRSGKEVLSLEGIAKSFAGKSVLSGVQLLACRGERIGVVGPNGSGKSTLLKLIAGLLAPSAGSIRYGKDVEIGYFGQELAELDPGNTVIEELLAARHMTLLEARTHLARFLFRGEDVFKTVAVLSGGERNRLTLAKLVLAQANLLLLDEPTNHLDIPSREALEESLQGYEGTLIFVSHDRYLLGSLASRIWAVSSGGVIDFPGTYGDYRAKLAAELQNHDAAQQAHSTAPGPSGQESPWAARLKQRALARASERAVLRATGRLQELEEAIALAEDRKREVEETLSDPALYSDAERAKTTTQVHRDVLSALEQLYEEWEKLAAQLDDLSSAL